MATPTPWLPVLSNIAPPEIRRKEALLREFNKIVELTDLWRREHTLCRRLTELHSL
ncbi:hypothetical protein J6590_106738, partial [Homalodisca vitripennis]